MRYHYAPGSAAADDRAFSERLGIPPAPAPAYVVLRPMTPYDLATPGTPQGITQLAATAEAGGWRHRAALAVASSPDGAEVVASLGLRLEGDLPGRARRAFAVWLRRVDKGAGGWLSGGALLLDEADPRRVRRLGVAELRAVLLGQPYTPPPPKPPAFKVPCPTCGRWVSLTSQGRIYASHRCGASTMEGRS